MRWIVTSMALASVAISGQARAGVFADDLSRCLVTKTSEADQNVLMRWLFSAFALDPTLGPLTKITPDQRKQFTKDAAGVYNRLILVDCRAQTIAALKNESGDAIGPAFNTLGQSTAKHLFQSPAAVEELKQLGESFDAQGLKKLGKEAGVPDFDK
ncbi:MAG: hypothetical protein HOP91_08780 [Sphingomonas sp.]|nr:hypothetical protein [Sphingomonas sp.]